MDYCMKPKSIFRCYLSFFIKRQHSLALVLILTGSPAIHAGWHERKAEGWAWYEERKSPDNEEQREKEPPKEPSYSDEMQAVRKKLKEKLAKALLDPSPENIQSYMEEQQKWTERSSYFAKVGAFKQTALKFHRIWSLARDPWETARSQFLSYLLDLPFLGKGKKTRNGSAATWKYFNLRGKFDFSDERMLDSMGLALPKNLGLKLG